MKYNKFDEAALENVLKDLTIPSIDKRSVMFATGKQGAINAEVAFREAAAEYGGNKLSAEVRQSIIDKVEALHWEEGLYTVDENGITYNGLKL